MRQVNPNDPLTDIELEVLACMARGLTNDAIGREMYRALDTVKTHVAHILDKLDAANRTHAISVAYERGVLQPVYLDHPAITQTLNTMRKGEWAA